MTLAIPIWRIASACLRSVQYLGMSRPAPPVLTVQSDWSQRSSRQARTWSLEVTCRADMRVAHPLIARAHLVLRFDRGKWVAIDNGSPTGMFVNGRRMRVVDIRDRQSINIGRPDGPRLTFLIGRHDGAVGQLPPTVEGAPAITPPGNSRPYRRRAHTARRHRSGSYRATAIRPAHHPPAGHGRRHRIRPAARAAPSAIPSQPAPPPGPQTCPATAAGTQRRSAAGPAAAAGGERSTAHRDRGKSPRSRGVRQRQPAARRAAVSIEGRGAAPGLRHHRPRPRLRHRHPGCPGVARSRLLVSSPIGMEIHDAQSINGTFVNGTRILSAPLTDGDVVTIGNVDLVFNGEILLRRAEAATRTGGLEVREVDFEVENKRLIQKVSLTARPGTLTALIGGSGAGKSTLSRLIAGATCPSAGSITFEGHDIHASFASLRSRIGMVPARRRRAPPADGEPGAELCRRAAAATRHQQIRPRAGRGTGYRGTRVDQACRHSGGQAVRWAAQTRFGGAGAAYRPIATDPRRADIGSGSGTGPAGHDDAAAAGRRWAGGAGSDALAELPRSLRPGVTDGARRQDGVLRPARRDRGTMGTTNWAQIFRMVGADPDEANRRFLAQAKPTPAAGRRRSRPILVPHRAPAPAASSLRLRVARSG